jgi:hypothetical protein
VLGRVAAEPLPEPGGHGPRLVELFRRPQRDELPGRLRAEQVSEDPLPMVGVVHEQQEVTQAQQRVRALRRAGQLACRPVHIADRVNPHAVTLRRAAREAGPVAGNWPTAARAGPA